MRMYEHQRVTKKIKESMQHLIILEFNNTLTFKSSPDYIAMTEYSYTESTDEDCKSYIVDITAEFSIGLYFDVNSPLTRFVRATVRRGSHEFGLDEIRTLYPELQVSTYVSIYRWLARLNRVLDDHTVIGD